MDDRQLNPLKTGVMFVALGPPMDPGTTGLPRHCDHLSRLRADVGLDALEVELTSVPQPSWSFRQLLEQIGVFFCRQGPVST
jgi:hypothetical protein